LQAAVGLARQQPEKLESSLQRIERECERMDRLVGELLTLSRLEAGMTSGMEESVDIDELVADVICDARFEAESSGHGVDFSGVSALSVKGNAELLHRAFENVVRNALKHSPEDGRIRVEASRSGNGGNFHLAVLDHGSGVPDKYLEAIFEPFFRAGGSRSGDGHGLGLAITRRVIEAHGGKVFATNRPEGGLSIEIELPTELSVP
jgi:signal transduction histidine kinase